MASNDTVVLAAFKFPLGHRRYTILSKTKSKNCTSGASGVVKKEASDRVSDSLSDGVSDAWSDTSPALYDTPSDTPSDHVGRADRPPLRPSTDAESTKTLSGQWHAIAAIDDDFPVIAGFGEQRNSQLT
jgi:hypothetical protein